MSTDNSMSSTGPSNGTAPAHILPADVLDWTPFMRDVCIIIFAIVPLTFGLRQYVKLVLVRRYQADDWALLAAVILFLPVATIPILFTAYAARLDASDFSVIPQITALAKTFNSLYAVSATACKISALLLVLNLIGATDRPSRWLVISTTCITGLLGACYFALSFTCGLTHTSYDTQGCGLVEAANGVTLAWSIALAVCDVCFTGACARLIWAANLGLRTRVVAIALLSLTSVGAVASVLRVAVLLGWGWTSQDGARLRLVTWSVLEGGTSIFGMCAVACRPLVRKVFGNSGAGSSKSVGTARTNERWSRSVVRTQVVMVQVENGDAGKAKGKGRASANVFEV